ncbi:GNAT family N-acetyltransferase [Rhodococcus sp. X156]|uniref:GNAT family N-acetyltransferase n=1 Tax=Rhodococcus sp. X156 TaxID=2499145 RepID=UPI000FD94A9B|nr:GNAT family N-acetyltransferase [Rhodococcus sp. X156]
MTPVHRSWSADLDTPTLYRLLALRVEVFVVEQACPYPELDGADLLPQTRHLWLQEGENVLGTVRLMQPDGDGGDFRIGRLCVARHARGHGHARRLMQAALAEVGSQPCRLNAQVPMVGFYETHGFASDGSVFVEDGIKHLPMLRSGA